MEYKVLSNGRGGGVNYLYKKEIYSIWNNNYSICIVKINIFFCLEEEKILVRKDNVFKVFIRMIMNIVGKYINDDYV